MGTVRGRGLDRIDRATMAGAVADRSWRVSTPEAIDADLAALWRDVGRGETSVARAVMSNLIVFRSPTSAAGGDMPTCIWWTEDMSDAAPSEALLTVGRQLVYDSRRWRDVRRGAAAMAPLVRRHRVDLADLNWRRLA